MLEWYDHWQFSWFWYSCTAASLFFFGILYCIYDIGQIRNREVWASDFTTDTMIGLAFFSVCWLPALMIGLVILICAIPIGIVHLSPDLVLLLAKKVQQANLKVNDNVKK